MIIADDHELARAGLRNMLEGDRSLTLVGEARNGREAVALCKQLKPDLALLDVRMPEMDGLAAARAIRQACPETRVLIVTTHENPDYLLAALKAGAVGYVLKEVTRQDLLSTIRRVLGGESVLSGEIAVRAIQHMAVQQTSAPSMRAERLTPREREVLEQSMSSILSPSWVWPIVRRRRCVRSKRGCCAPQASVRRKACQLILNICVSSCVV
jgi:DNA-binding NarL/FixJ family response regulator